MTGAKKMSRIGKRAIVVPNKVEVTLANGDVTVKGPKGSLTRQLPEHVSMKVEAGVVHVEQSSTARVAGAMHGLARSLVANMVVGVSKGFVRDLEINGVGYKVESIGKGKFLRFDLGYSHPIFFELPAGLTATIGRGNKLKLECIDNEMLGQAAATIRSFRPPEPYKGKGIKYSDEVIIRKVGKAGSK
jgi:large subunit ribosomal protein L6